MEFRKAACRLHTHIPHPRIKFHNVNSLSAHPQDKEGQKRKRRIIKHITELLKGTDILCLQETHLGSRDSITLTTNFRNHLIFHNNLSLGKAGTIIMVCKEYASGYDINQLEMGEVAKGRVQNLHFSSRIFPHKAKASFNVVNVYLSAGNSHAQRCRELASLSKLERTGHIFMCGDFNMTDNEVDSPTASSYLTMRGDTLRAWEELLDTLDLREVPQDTHTHYFITTTVQLPVLQDRQILHHT